MPRHMLPQVGTTVWYFTDPTRRPQAAIVTKRVTPTNYILSLFKALDGTVGGVTGVPFYELGAKAASGQFCTPTGIQDELDGAADMTTLSQRATAAAITAGGTGYAVGNVLTLPANTGPVVLTVTTVAAGVITGVSITNPGNATKPGPAPAQAATGGTGSGATFTITWADN